MTETQPSQPFLALRGVSVTYTNGSGPIAVFGPTDFQVGPGEFLAVVGPTGCGKTTLLRVLGALLRPTEGKVMLRGQEVAEGRRGREFSYVFQNPVLLPWRTLRANVALPSEVFGDKAVLGRVDEMIKLVGLEEFAERYPDELSGGMKSRAAIARALTFEPEVLLMDEPFAALDETTRLKMNLELLRVWRETGATVVFVTHSLNEAAFLGDRILIMGPRPSGLIAEIANRDLPRPRTIEMLESPAFLRRLREVRSKFPSWENGNGPVTP